MTSNNLLLKKIIALMISLTITIIHSWIPSVSNAESLYVHDKPNRIVVFPLHAEEILLNIVDSSRIVYVGHLYLEDGEIYSPSMELTKTIEGGAWQDSDEEDILSLQPDLIFLGADLEEYYWDGDLFTAFSEAGVPVVFIKYPESLNDIIENIRLIGDAVAEREKADSLIQSIISNLYDCEDNTASNEMNRPVKILYYNHWQNSFWIISEILGLKNLYYDEYVNLEPSEIAIWNPDIILYNPFDQDSDGTILSVDEQYSIINRDVIMQKPELQTTSAVKNDHVFPFFPHVSQYITLSLAEVQNYLSILEP